MATKKKAATMAVQVAVNSQRLDTVEKTLEDLVAAVQRIEEHVQRNKGFWGAVVMIGGAVTALLTTFKDQILAAFRVQ